MTSLRDEPIARRHEPAIATPSAGDGRLGESKIEHALHRLAACASATGPDLYHAIVHALTDALGARWALLGAVDEDEHPPAKVRTVAVLADGAVQDDVEYDLAGTPCAEVLRHGTVRFAGDLKQRFPDDFILHEMGVAYYLGTPLRSSDGRLLGVLAVQHDSPLDESLHPEPLLELLAARAAAALELEQKMRALAQSERTLADFFDNAAIGLHWVDRDGIIIRANRAELQMMGFAGREGEYLGRHIADFHADRHVIEDILARLARGETLNDHPARLLRRDGSIRHVLITSNVLFENGEFVHTRCFTRDVTDQREAEEAFRSSEEFNRRLIDASTDCIKVLDLQGRLLSMSQGGQRRMGIDDLAPYLKTPWTDWWKGQRSEAEQAVRFAAAGGAGKFEGCCPTTDGTPRWWEVIISPIRDWAGKPVRLLAVSRDVTDRRHTEQRLRESRRRLATLLANLPGMAYRCPTEPPWPLTFVSEGVHMLTGHSAADFMEQRVSWMEVMHPEDTDAVAAEIERAIKERRIFSLVYRILHTSGEIRWVLDRGQPVHDESGNAVAFEGFVGDLTKQIQAEQDRARQHTELQTLLDTLPVGVFFAHDPQCKRITGNRAGYEMLRMAPQSNLSVSAPDEERPVHFRVCKDGVELPPDQLPVQRAALGEIVRSEEIDTVFDDGSVMHQLISAAPLLNPDRTVRGSVASILDITERKRAEIALRESESRFRVLVDMLPAAVYRCEADGRVSAFNRRAAELWGREPELGESDQRFCGALRLYWPDGRRLPHEKTPMAACLADGQPRRDAEVVIERPDGSRITVLANISPLHDEHGNLIGAINCFQDITQRKRDEQRLHQSHRRVRVLYDLTAAAGRAQRLKDVYEAALEGLREALDADRSSILLSDDVGVMRFAAWRGLSDAYRVAVEGHSPWEADDPDPQPIFIEDAEQADLGHLREVVLGEGIRSLGFFPLTHNGRLLGKFTVYHANVRCFNEEEVRLARAIADHIAFAIVRQRADAALHRSEEEFRALAEHTPDVIARFDRDLRHLYINPAIQAATGIECEAFLGRTKHEVGMPAEHCDRWERLCREVFETGERRDMEFDFREPQTGAMRRYQTRVVPELDALGKVQTVLAVSRDITTVREAEQRQRQLADSMPQIVWTCRADGSTEYMNDRWYEYTGVERGRLDDDAWINSLHPDDQDRCVRMVRESNQSGRPFETEIRIRRGSTGEYRWHLARRVPMVDDRGRVLRWVGTSTDIHDSKQAAEAQSRLAAIVASSQDAILSKTLDGTITSWNTGAERTFGYAADEAIGRNITMLIPPDRLDEDHAIRKRVRGGKRVEPYETVRRRKDGRFIDVWLAVSPIADEAGRIVGASQIARDITDRKRAEALLRESESRLKLAMEAGHMGAWEWSLGSGSVRWSPGLEAIHGLQPGSFGGTFEDATRGIHPEDRERVLDAIRRAVEGPSPYHIEYRILLPDRRLHWIEARGRVIADETGKPERMAGVCMDITQRKRAAEEAVAQQAFREALERSVAAGIIAIDIEGRQTYVNRAFCEMVGYTEEELIGRTAPMPYWPREDMARIQQCFDAALQREASSAGASFEMRFKRKDGSLFDGLVVVSPLLTAGGEPKSYLAAVTDITQQKRNETELARHRDQLEELVIERTVELEASYEQLRQTERMAALGTLSAGLGHDMGNLLLPLRLRLDAIERKMQTFSDDGQQSAVASSPQASHAPTEADESRAMLADVQDDILAIRKCAEYLQRLTNGLRLFALDPNDEQAGETLTDLNQWWNDVEPFLKNALPRHVELARDLPPTGDLPEVGIARHLLTQAVFNLVQNAGDAIRSSGERATADKSRAARVCVSMQWNRRQGVVRVAVSDNGPGMTADVRKRCMEPFFTTKPRGLSTGLGLALVHGIVLRAGGRMEIDSAIGKGTTMTITLPAAGLDEGVEAPGASATEPLAASPAQECALVTVAEPRMRAFAGSVLRALSCDVHGFDRDAKDEPPSVASCDLWIVDDAQRVGAESPRLFAGGRLKRIVLVTSGASGVDPVLLQDDRVVLLDPAEGRAGFWRTLRAVVAEIRRESKAAVQEAPPSPLSPSSRA